MREEKSRDLFQQNQYLLKKTRNPIMGELTPRDTAESLIPIDKFIKDTVELQKFQQTKQIRLENQTREQEQLHNDVNYHPSIHNQIKKMRLQPTHPLKDRKEFLSSEHERVQQLMEYQKNKLLSTMKR